MEFCWLTPFSYSIFILLSIATSAMEAYSGPMTIIKNPNSDLNSKTAATYAVLIYNRLHQKKHREILFCWVEEARKRSVNWQWDDYDLRFVVKHDDGTLGVAIAAVEVDSRVAVASMNDMFYISMTHLEYQKPSKSLPGSKC
ncbi:hypothetical protein KSP39_PZI015824 [Platanthera zijinensis]|uniref:rRNA N-glycosidase n=1 Tax=Platanthera zijinensis TaxID=2320716 RepID=A0AAP0G1H0_9ASPA